MSTLTMPAIKDLGIKISTKLRKEPLSKPTIDVPIPVETPRQQILRLLDRVVHEHGEFYVDNSHTPTRMRIIGMSPGRDYGCIVGQIVGKAGYSPQQVHEKGLDRCFEELGWVRELNMLTTLIRYNDSDIGWGRIQEMVHQAYDRT